MEAAAIPPAPVPGVLEPPEPPVSVPEPQDASPYVSLRDKARARRAELFSDKSATIPVSGYEDLGIYARYNLLGFKILRTIGLKNDRVEKNTPKQDRETIDAADTLIRALIEFMEKIGEDSDGKPVFQSLGHTEWTPRMADEIFGVSLAAETLSRDVVFAILPDTELMSHYARYSKEVGKRHPEVEEILEGESGPSQEGT